MKEYLSEARITVDRCVSLLTVLRTSVANRPQFVVRADGGDVENQLRENNVPELPLFNL
jgi:hypothetical protein